MSSSFVDTFARIVRLGREDAKGPEAMGLKLMEEVGEFAEAINFACGYLPHKKMKEPAIGEAADAIQNVICILGVLYPDKSPHELFAELTIWLDKKTDKWEEVLVRKDTGVDIHISELEIADTQPAVMYINLPGEEA
jgi:NTP pyrophosphatase (non-canonical NTP hydrolase)